MSTPDPTLERMGQLVRQWEASADRRAVFLRCYAMMTENMLAAIERDEFIDRLWVDRLLRHFADYYFNALSEFDRDPLAAPAVWQQAHGCTVQPQAVTLAMLLAGVNAHINFDLVLTLVDLLEPEWAGLEADWRQVRYQDYCRVNQIIAGTIDAVQDQVLEPAMPLMEWLDRLLGPVDELLISRLITAWREAVWGAAIRLLETPDPAERGQIIRYVEEEALSLGRRIGWLD